MGEDEDLQGCRGDYWSLTRRVVGSDRLVVEKTEDEMMAEVLRWWQRRNKLLSKPQPLNPLKFPKPPTVTYYLQYVTL